ncbi:MAG: hypothetical protein JWM89_2809 [Acidimicrobiales bacterium]|nr:hypothetical protein [Acidimicrobiales bacterium]
MEFVQAIEFDAPKDVFKEMTARYEELMHGESTARRTVLFEDRDRPGHLVQLVWFESYESAMKNNDHPGTQQFATEASERFGEATFRNLDVVDEHQF